MFKSLVQTLCVPARQSYLLLTKKVYFPSDLAEIAKGNQNKPQIINDESSLPLNDNRGTKYTENQQIAKSITPVKSEKEYDNLELNKIEKSNTKDSLGNNLGIFS